MGIRLPKITFWRVVATAILVSGVFATFFRITRGLGGSTHLSDQFPWGLWIGFDILCGVGLAAGGFTIAATVHIFNAERFHPIVRPTILTAFLGYLLVIVGLMYDLGRPFQIWHAFIMWNPRSVMFEVAWCVILYTTVLALEFSPVVLERFRLKRALRVMRSVSIPLIMVGVLLSTLHQSSLGSLYLIVPAKLYPLWYTPYLPVLFFVSAVGAGLSMVVLESCLSSRAFRRGLEIGLLRDIARGAVVVFSVYGAMKLVDLASRGQLGLLLTLRNETYLYWAELLVGIALPITLFASPRARASRGGLLLGAATAVIGFVLNRMNVSITGLEAWAGRPYFPSWMEISVTLSIVTLGFIAFALAARHLPVFDDGRAGRTAGERAARKYLEDLRLASQGS